MFLHHTMTDREILRTCEGCDSQHLRLVADRLRARVEDLRVIGTLASRVMEHYHIDDVWVDVDRIAEIAKGK